MSSASGYCSYLFLEVDDGKLGTFLKFFLPVELCKTCNQVRALDFDLKFEVVQTFLDNAEESESARPHKC